MFAHALGVSVGLVLLLYGAQRAVDAAIDLARAFGLPTLLIGGTLVAIGSSVPEISTALYAGLYGAGDFAVGHVVGSATSQITVGIGVVALLSPLSLERGKIAVYGVGMIAAMGVMLLVVESGAITRVEGVAMVALYCLFLVVRVHADEESVTASSDGDPDRPLGHTAGWMVVGFVLVAVGGHLLVAHSEAVAVSLGVPAYLLGLVTGFGTTVPEITIAALAVHRNEGDIAVGTLLGSNVTDPLFSLGVGAIVGGFAIERVGATLTSATYMMVAAGLVALWFFLTGGISRRAAVGCIALYVPTFLL